MLYLISLIFIAKLCFSVPTPPYPFNLENISPYKKFFQDDIPINYISKSHNLYLKYDDLKWRLQNRKYSYIGGPIKIKIEAKNLKDLSVKIAKPNLETKVLKILETKKRIRKGNGIYKVAINKNLLPLINYDLIEERTSTITYDLFIDLSKLSGKKLEQFIKFTQSNEPQTLRKKIKNLQDNNEYVVSIVDLLFPRFAKERVNTFTHFYGPNCFHSSLAFHKYGIEYDKKINYKIESTLNYNFINNYEYLNALKKRYNELNYKKDPLRFGDIIVLYSKQISPDGTHYKSIKHGSTYIGNGFVFVKGSKHPNKPYRIARFTEDYAFWKNKLKDIGIRVFRKK